VEQIPGGYKVLDANGQALAHVYGRETRGDADTANVLTMDEARRMASNIVKPPKAHDLGSSAPERAANAEARRPSW
jgi:hypothetical protein